MNSSIIAAAVITGVFVLIMLFVASRYKKVKHEGQAIIVNGLKDSTATLTGAMCWPIINTYQTIDITRKKISVIRIGANGVNGEETEGLHCKDNIRADLKVDFYIGVNHDPDDIKNVAKVFTPEGASDQSTLESHFLPKFSEALKTACKQFDFVELFEERAKFREAVKEVINHEMDGFKIYDVVIDKVDQTSLDAHDANNVLDSEGIRKIREITSEKNILTNIITQDEETKLKEKDVAAIEQRLQLDKQEKEATAKQEREVAIIQAQEAALAKEKEEEFKLQEETALIKREEETEKRREQKEMEVKVTILNNEKKIKVQEEDVTRTGELEKVETQKQIAAEDAEKDLVVEEGAKKVAEVQSQRVEIERKIAKEEEETKNLRASETVNREKNVQVVEAEAKAEAEQVELITKAKAEKIAAAEVAERVKTESEAELFQKEQEAKSIAVIADAEKKKIAAVGLAEVEVEERRAQAIEKTGKAEAVSIREKGQAEADAQEAEFVARKAEAATIREVGIAAADAKEAELKAAEAGSEAGMDYAKWLREQEIEENVRLAKIGAEKEVGIENAKAVGQAISSADVKLFGGEGLDAIRNSIMNSASLDAKIAGSEHLTQALKRYENGDENLIKDIKDVLEKSEVSSGDLANLTVAQLLTQHPNIAQQLMGALGNK